jgi:hypothetical protein
VTSARVYVSFADLNARSRALRFSSPRPGDLVEVTGVPAGSVVRAYADAVEVDAENPLIRVVCTEGPPGHGVWYDSSIRAKFFTEPHSWSAGTGEGGSIRHAMLERFGSAQFYVRKEQLVLHEEDPEGGCPRCWRRGVFVRTALCCPEHGPYAGF